MEEAAAKEQLEKKEAGEEPKKGYTCRFCGATFTDGMELGRHVQKEHQEELKAERRAKKAKAPPTPGPPKPPRIAAQDEAIDFLAERLPDIYGMSSAGARAAVERLKERPEIVWDLNALYYHIKQYAGKQVNEYDLRWLLSSVQSRLSQAGEVVQPPFVVQPPRQPYQPMPAPYPQAPQVQPQHYAFQFPWQAQPVQVPTPPPPPPRPPRTYKLVVDGQEIETDEKGYMAWSRYLDERKKTGEKPPPPLTKAEVEAMIKNSTEGTVKAVKDLLREEREAKEKETLTATVAESVERQDRLLEKIEKGEIFPKATSEAPPPTKEEIAKMAADAASEAAAKVSEAKAKEEREEKRHGELLSAIRSGLSGREVLGYKEDSYRLLGQGLTSVAGALERKEPIRVVLEHAPEIRDVLYGAPKTPGPKELAPGAAGEEMARELSKLKPDWVVEE